jgi:uncharacterized protein (TIGR02996 family)
VVTEDAFQAALDERPDDAALRLVFADWLEEHGDTDRAAGYRWLGGQGLYPYDWSGHGGAADTFDWYVEGGEAYWGVPAHCTLPAAWLDLLPQQSPPIHWVERETRREAEEAVCLVLAKLARMTLDDVTWDVTPLESDVPVEGNFDSGDPKADRRTEQWIARQLAGGNPWAWCMARVVGRYAGLEAMSFLGCCSYRSEREFRKGAYCEDMRQDVFEQLRAQADAILRPTAPAQLLSSA